MRKAILSADDFARSHERNLAVDEAIKSGLICSVAILVNSDYTAEAAELASRGGYLNRLHCHLSLAYGEKMSGNSKPLNREFAECPVFCENGEFRHPFYNKYDFLKYVDITYMELEAQFLRFRELTEGRGNEKHLDVHLYNNRSYPFALAYRKLIKNYHIETCRYYGVHHKTIKQTPYEKKRLWLSSLLCGRKANYCKSCNVDYFLTRPEEFVNDDVFELYVHPDYSESVLMDNTESVFGHEKRPLCEQIEDVRRLGIQLISWTEI